MQKTYEHIYICTNYLIRLVGFQNGHHHCVLLEKQVLVIYNMSYNNSIPIWLKQVYITNCGTQKRHLVEWLVLSVPISCDQ